MLLGPDGLWALRKQQRSGTLPILFLPQHVQPGRPQEHIRLASRVSYEFYALRNDLALRNVFL